MTDAPDERVKVVGRNGVAVAEPTATKAVKYLVRRTGEHRTYEVHQRERVGESTEKIKPIQLVSEEFRRDPYPLLQTLREHYPFYRDWLANSYWVTRYNDVTSIFVDEANFESRAKLWGYGRTGFGRDFGQDLRLQMVETERTDALCGAIADEIIGNLSASSEFDLAVDFAGQFALRLQAEVLGIPADQHDVFNALFWRMQRGDSWHSQLRQDGLAALQEMTAFLAPLVTQRKANPQDDLLSALVNLEEDVTIEDVVVTLLERDHETLHGALANMWCNLLLNPEEFAKARSERRLMKLAYLETLRHSTPVVNTYRYARHEVERFGKLIPAGARLVCSAAAGNRDGRVFNDPDRFIVDRKDLCQREPRGQYRADGLATGVTFGLGKPSIHPAVPEDRPRSRYALVRDTAVEASMRLIEALPNVHLIAGETPHLSALTIGEMHTCWRLPASAR